MNLIIADPIFNEYPDLILSAVIAHNIDNAQARDEITELLRTVESVLSGRWSEVAKASHRMAQHTMVGHHGQLSWQSKPGPTCLA